MRYFISFIIFLFCSNALFAQNDSDTATITLKEVTIRKVVKPISHGPVCILYRYQDKRFDSSENFGIVLINIPAPSKIVHTNHSEFGLPTKHFRFENINRMANTVAGVLCY